MLFIDNAALANCENLQESYGEICVSCNACGRLDESTHKQIALEMYKSRLKEEQHFDSWIEGFEDIQRGNIAENIIYFKSKIAELEGTK